MGENTKEIQTLREKMDAAKAKIFDSSEYKLMKNNFEKIEKLTEELKSYKDAKKVPEKTTDALREAYIELAEKTDRYIALKKIVPSSERGEKRLDLAKELKEFAYTKLEKLSIYLDKETEKEEPVMEEEVLRWKI